MAKFLMVQGTTSDAGKSLVVTGLCRLFKNMGYKVAPFKAQNLTSNGFVTSEGLEMGKAQVLQAEAAGAIPMAKMNPLLVKPIGPGNLKVLALGKEWVSPDGRPYKEHKEYFEPLLKDALDSLARDNDIVVIEGAGSPAEINIKDGDLVNMFIAKMVNAPVLLVSDIERGGVFASLVGTLTLLDPVEEDLVKGLIINKFRGNMDLLRDGLSKLEQITEKPIIGVMPYLDVDIEPEDSLSALKGSSNMVYSDQFRETQYEILAKGVSENLDVNLILNIMGIK